jgi:molecular chaperone GrpE (heat shock protein)
MPIMRDKKGLAASAAGRAKSEKKKLPEGKAAATKPAPAQPQTANATPAKPAPVIAPKPAPMIAPQKVSGDAKPVNRPAAAPVAPAKPAVVTNDAKAVSKETPAPAKPSNVTPIKSASSEVAKAQQQAVAPAPAPTSPPARPIVDVKELAQAVIAHTTPALEAGFKKVDARLEKVESRVEAAEAAAKRAEAKAGAAETAIAERIEKLAKSTAKAAQAAEAAREAAVKPEPVVPMGLEAELDQIGRTVKRAFVESFERSMDHVALPLVKVQRYIEEIARRAGNEAPGLSEHLSICVTSLGAVLTDLGVESFEPEAHEEFDPIIHQQVGDAHRADVSANAIVKCVAPGYRSAGGHVLLPALVVVNRK